MIYVLLANGFEEIEAIATVDILRRSGLDTQTVTINDSLNVLGAHGIEVKADLFFSQIDRDKLKALVLPGGMPGATHLSESKDVSDLILHVHEQEYLLAAICAAPSVLGKLGVLEGRKATCYPGFESKLKGALIRDDRVVKDGHIITAKGAGCACEFAFKIVSILASKDKAASIEMGMMFD